MKKDIPNLYKLYYDIFYKGIIINNIIPLKINYLNDDLNKRF
jgi:hypothetical protein